MLEQLVIFKQSRSAATVMEPVLLQQIAFHKTIRTILSSLE